jgi:hypothetical protein
VESPVVVVSVEVAVEVGDVTLHVVVRIVVGVVDDVDGAVVVVGVDVVGGVDVVVGGVDVVVGGVVVDVNVVVLNVVVADVVEVVAAVDEPDNSLPVVLDEELSVESKVDVVVGSDNVVLLVGTEVVDLGVVVLGHTLHTYRRLWLHSASFSNSRCVRFSRIAVDMHCSFLLLGSPGAHCVGLNSKIELSVQLQPAVKFAPWRCPPSHILCLGNTPCKVPINCSSSSLEKLARLPSWYSAQLL